MTENETIKQNSEAFVFPTDPNDIRKMLGSILEIKLSDTRILKGHLVTIDPISMTVVLLVKTSNEKKLHVINHVAIREIKILSTEHLYIQLYDCNTQEIEDKERLKEWFKANGIELQEDGYVLKHKDFYIEPPYTINHCFCNNSLALANMKDIIRNMPVEKERLYK